MIKKITITSEGDFDKITFSREKNSPYIDMEFNYHNGCRYSSFKLEDMIKVIEILKEQDKWKYYQESNKWNVSKDLML